LEPIGLLTVINMSVVL